MVTNELKAIIMLDAPCDRCGKQAHELRAFKLSETITYRGKVIEMPWLCLPCIRVEKRKWWKQHGN